MKLCDLKTAKALQEIGYDEASMDYYLHGKLNGFGRDGAIYPFGLWEDFNAIGKEDLQTDLYSAPRLDDAAYWIRDKYHLSIRLNYGRGFGWFADILNLITGEYIDCNFKPTYDDALEAAVTKAIEIIKNKKQ